MLWWLQLSGWLNTVHHLNTSFKENLRNNEHEAMLISKTLFLCYFLKHAFLQLVNCIHLVLLVRLSLDMSSTIEELGHPTFNRVTEFLSLCRFLGSNLCTVLTCYPRLTNPSWLGGKDCNKECIWSITGGNFRGNSVLAMGGGLWDNKLRLYLIVNSHELPLLSD